MLTCPNDDINFSKTLSKILNSDPTPEDRKKIYYLVCIVFRLSLLLFLYYNCTKPIVQYFSLIFTLVSIIKLSSEIKKGPNTQWWSKKFDLVMSSIMFLVSILVIFNKTNPIYLPIIFGISLLGGFLQSLSITFC